MANTRDYETLLHLLDRYTIQIPIVQRDYAQGRQEQQVSEIRKALLADIYASLKNGVHLDLNFVYGKVKESQAGLTFIPIDGQQRLTTLWLLHLYAFHNNPQILAKLARFSYQTRKSSRQFLHNVIQHSQEIFASNLIPSQEIGDSAWFLPAWHYDPTVASILTMLDDVKKLFGNFNQETQLDLCDQLQAGYLRFEFLDTKIIASEDDLYIKLNARGRALSPFDNLKSIIIEPCRRAKKRV